MTAYFIQAFIYLFGGSHCGATGQAAGFGVSVGLSYCISSPSIGLVRPTNTIQHFAEFGVVMMLLLVGMELDPKSLWAMRVRLGRPWWLAR